MAGNDENKTGRNMFVLKKAISPWVLPPGLFVMVMILIAAAMFFRKHWRWASVNLITGLTLWALSIAPVSDRLMRGLESEFTIPEKPSGDVIILLGGGVVRQVPDISGSSAPSSSSLARIVTAVRLHKKTRLPMIVTGGAEDGYHVAVAIIAKRYLMDLGVPENQILVEDRARDTEQNATLAAVLCRQQGYRRPILLTAAYHLKRACMAFDAAGLSVTPFPAYFLGSRDSVYTWRDWLPNAGSLQGCARALHEYVGLLYYRVKEALAA
jgi:uncharacterized SAM-binding protein YcdF (DUF218 family)